MTLYDAVKGQLKSVAWIKWTDLDSGQLDNAEKRKALKMPCALIQENSVFSDLTENGEMHREDATLTIRLVWDATGIRTNANAPETVQERSLSYTNQVKEVYNLLQGSEPGDFSSLECTNGQQETRHDGLTVYKFVFKTSRIVVKE